MYSRLKRMFFGNLSLRQRQKLILSNSANSFITILIKYCLYYISIRKNIYSTTWPKNIAKKVYFFLYISCCTIISLCARETKVGIAPTRNRDDTNQEGQESVRIVPSRADVGGLCEHGFYECALYEKPPVTQTVTTSRTLHLGLVTSMTRRWARIDGNHGGATPISAVSNRRYLFSPRDPASHSNNPD